MIKVVNDLKSGINDGKRFITHQIDRPRGELKNVTIESPREVPCEPLRDQCDLSNNSGSKSPRRST